MESAIYIAKGKFECALADKKRARSEQGYIVDHPEGLRFTGVLCIRSNGHFAR